MKTMLAVLLITLAGGPLLRAQSMPYRYEPGKSYFYDVRSSTKSKEEMGENVRTYTTAFTAVIVLRVQERDAAGLSSGTLVIETLEATVDRRDGIQRFGEELAGNAYQFALDASGRITKRDPALAALDPQRLEIVQRLLNVLPPLGRATVMPGDSWKNTTVDSVGTPKMPMVEENRVSFEVGETRDILQRSCLAVEYDADVFTTGVMLQYGKSYDYDSRGSSEGTLFYDPKEGIVVRFDLEQGSNDTITESGKQGAIYLEHNATVTYELRQVR